MNIKIMKSKKIEYLEVEILKETIPCWYKIGEKHKVLNKITFGFSDNDAHFSKEEGVYGIRVSDCKILNPTIKKLTVSEIEDELGYRIEVVS